MTINVQRHDGAVWTGTSWSHDFEARALYPKGDLPEKLPGYSDRETLVRDRRHRAIGDVYWSRDGEIKAYTFEDKKGGKRA